MSATTSNATVGQSSHVSALAATVALAAIVAFGATAAALSQGAASSSVAQPVAAAAAVTSATMPGPRTAAQKRLVSGLSAQTGESYPDYGQRISGLADRISVGRVSRMAPRPQ